MATILAQVFIALVVSLLFGFLAGLAIGAHRRSTIAPAATTSREPGAGAANEAVDPTELRTLVEREASLIEALARADDDLRAHARELADANEEINCLLEQLHEARRSNA